MTQLTRRHLLSSGAALLAASQASRATTAREIGWEDLIPTGVPYSEIVGPGVMDEETDYWAPVYDANATKLNETLDGAYIRMPGFIIPIEIGAEGVTSFILVPYVGACIHVPPPPANQLVFVTAAEPWPGDELWDAVWVTGRMRTRLQSTEFGQAGYEMTADLMQVYEW